MDLLFHSGSYDYPAEAVDRVLGLLLSRVGTPVWQRDSTEPVLSIDGRVLEDVTGLATVSSSGSDAIEGSDLEIVARSSRLAARDGDGSRRTLV